MRWLPSHAQLSGCLVWVSKLSRHSKQHGVTRWRGTTVSADLSTLGVFLGKLELRPQKMVLMGKMSAKGAPKTRGKSWAPWSSPSSLQSQSRKILFLLTEDSALFIFHLFVCLCLFVWGVEPNGLGRGRASTWLVSLLHLKPTSRNPPPLKLVIRLFCQMETSLNW